MIEKLQSLQSKDEVKFRLPVGWSLTSLEKCVKILDSQRIPINAKDRERRKGDVPYYGATGQVGWIDDYLFNEELLLLGEDGSPFLEKNKNKSYIIRGKSWVNNHAHVLRALSQITSNSYLCHYLNDFDYA
jgi:type I restriction enzyme S subunit